MPENAENFEELLSAFLDGELSEDEFKQVQAELGRSEPLRRQLSELSDLSRELQGFYRNSSQARKAKAADNTLAARVIAEAQREAVQAGLPDDHHVRLAERAEIAIISEKKAVDWKKFARFGGWAAAVAAAIFLAVFVPGFFREEVASDQQALAVTEDGVSDETSTEQIVQSQRPQYVSEIDFQGGFVFVVDVELSAQARQNDALRKLLERAGLTNSEPIIGGFEIKKALSSSRSIIDPARDADASETRVYFVRGDFDAVAQVVDTIYADDQSFPRVAFDMAVDNPVAKLMETIARQTGERYAVDESFVAPVVVDSRDSEFSAVSPFGRLPKPSGLVSTAARKRGLDSNSWALLEKNGLTSVLLLVR